MTTERFAPAMDGSKEAGLYSVKPPSGVVPIGSARFTRRVAQAFTAAPEKCR